MRKEKTSAKSFATYLRFSTPVFDETVAIIEQEVRLHQRVRHLHAVRSYVEVLPMHQILSSPQLTEIAQNPDQLDFLLIPFWSMLSQDMQEVNHLLNLFSSSQIEINCPKQWVNFHDRGWKMELNRYLRR